MIDFNDIVYDEYDDNWEYLRKETYWKTKHKDAILICDLDDIHLKNTINFLKRRNMTKIDKSYEYLTLELEYRIKNKIKIKQHEKL